MGTKLQPSTVAYPQIDRQTIGEDHLDIRAHVNSLCVGFRERLG